MHMCDKHIQGVSWLVEIPCIKLGPASFYAHKCLCTYLPRTLMASTVYRMNINLSLVSICFCVPLLTDPTISCTFKSVSHTDKKIDRLPYSTEQTEPASVSKARFLCVFNWWFYNELRGEM